MQLHADLLAKWLRARNSSVPLGRRLSPSRRSDWIENPWFPRVGPYSWCSRGIDFQKEGFFRGTCLKKIRLDQDRGAAFSRHSSVVVENLSNQAENFWTKVLAVQTWWASKWSPKMALSPRRSILWSSSWSHGNFPNGFQTENSTTSVDKLRVAIVTLLELADLWQAAKAFKTTKKRPHNRTEKRRKTKQSISLILRRRKWMQPQHSQRKRQRKGQEQVKGWGGASKQEKARRPCMYFAYESCVHCACEFSHDGNSCAQVPNLHWRHQQ